MAAERLLVGGGVDSVSIRRVAAELGVAPMTLYGAFADKRALLEALARRLLDRHDLVPDGSLPLEVRARGWMVRYRSALRDSRLFELLGAGAPLTVMLEIGTAWVDQLVSEGFELDVAVRRAQLLLWSVHGFCMGEAGSVGPERLADEVGGIAERSRSLVELMEGNRDLEPLFALVVDATVSAVTRPA